MGIANKKILKQFAYFSKTRIFAPCFA